MPYFKTSLVGRAMIGDFEGRKHHAYPDPISGGDPWTVGIGCTGPGIGPGVVWTDAQIDEAFADRLAREFEPAVNRDCAGVPTTQGQFDALVSLHFNVGTKGGKDVTALHRAGKYDEAADAFLEYDHAAGREVEALLARRQKEAQMYLDASPAADAAAEPVQPQKIAEPVVVASGDIGHQKAIAALVVPPAVSLGAAAAASHGIDATPHIGEITALLSGLFVWLTPHGRGS